MKPIFEKVVPSENSSWRYWLYEIDELDFHWHYHPEYEIALTLNSQGQRYVGDNIQEYSDFDIALLGPHLPHAWCSDSAIKGQKQKVYVAQIPVSWVEKLLFTMPDLFELKYLFERSQRGIVFSKKTAKLAKTIFQQMHDSTPFLRFNGLMQILQLMLEDEAPEILASTGYKNTMFSDTSTDKLDTIIQYIHDNYTQNLKAEQVADLVHMSTNHFHRFFKQRTEQTFTELVNQLRIGKACSLLISSEKPITTISDMCGFNNISNFNRRFLQFKAMKPSEFRKIYLEPNTHT
jgi:AraC-like DNA-binding protein